MKGSNIRLRRLKILLYLILLVLFNLLIRDLPLRLDLTRSRIHTLSPAARHVIEDLEEPLIVKIYLSENLPGSYGNLKESLENLMASFKRFGKTNFRYEFHRILPGDKEMQEQAQHNGITPLALQDIRQDEVKLINAWAGINLLQGTRHLALPALNPESNLEYKITAAIRKLTRQSGLLAALDEDFSIRLETSSSLYDLDDSLRIYPLLLKQAIEEMNPLYFNRLDFTAVQTSETALQARLTIRGNDRTYSKDLLISDQKGINLLSPEETVSLIAEVISLLLGTGNAVGYLAGHGTTALYGDEGLNNFSRLVSELYEIHPVSLEKIPPDLTVLIICGPVEPFSSAELSRLDEFVSSGGSLAVFLNSHYEIFPGQEELARGILPHYEPEKTGLPLFLKKYGLSLESGFILDTSCYTDILEDENGGYTEVPVYYAPRIPEEKINRSYPVLASLKGLVGINVSPIEISEKDPDANTVLFLSSRSSWIMNEEINLFDPFSIHPPSGEDRNSFPLAVIHSTDNGHGKILLAGSPEFLGDRLIDPEGETPNAVLVLNLLDLLAGNPENALLRNKGVSYNPLNETTPVERLLFKIVNMGLLPLLTLLTALIMLIREKRRRNRIKTFFLGGGF